MTTPSIRRSNRPRPARPVPPPPPGVPVGGRRRRLLHPSPELVEALRGAATRLGTVDDATGGHEPDPATRAALDTLVLGLAMLPPVLDDRPEIRAALRAPVVFGWKLGVRVLGGPVRFTGPVEGTPAEATPAILSRASAYAPTVLTNPLGPTGLVKRAPTVHGDPDLRRVLLSSRSLRGGDVDGLLSTAILGGVAIAAAEWELFHGPPADDLVAGLESPAAPAHHHRFDLDEVVHIGGGGKNAHLGFRCLRTGCAVLRIAPPEWHEPPTGR